MSKQIDLLQRLTRSETGIRLALWLGQTMPKSAGHKFSKWVANWLAPRKHTALVKGIRINQWMAHYGKLNADELQDAVRAALQVNLRSLFDFYHNLNKPERVKAQIKASPAMEKRLINLLDHDRGALILAGHNSNFDLAGRALNLWGLKFQALSYPLPPSGYAMQNQIRQEGGMEVTPMSIEAFQQARRRLNKGGVVVTGVDRAIDATPRLKPMFFGRPSNLPVAYMQLALHNSVPILLVNVSTEEKGYRLDLIDEFEPVRYPDRDESLLRNTERVLASLEGVIRAKPQDWIQSYPAWDNIESELPD